jgi:hypothetical protein
VIVLLIATRDQAELLRHNLEHHLEWSIDHVAIVDNASVDDTHEVVRAFGDAVSARIVAGDAGDLLPALVEAFHSVEDSHGSIDWVGVSDTDEFWWSPNADLTTILNEAPPEIVGVNFEQKLFLPTELDRDEGPVFCRRAFRTSGPGSPLHTSYKEGKSFYRGSWVREHGISHGHWCAEIPHPPWRHQLPLVHHYMVEDEDDFVNKVRLTEFWRPQIRDRTVPPRLSAFRVAWWRLYEERSEEGLREYFRTSYFLRTDDVRQHLERGELVHDEAFSDFQIERLRRTGRKPSASSSGRTAR